MASLAVPVANVTYLRDHVFSMTVAIGTDAGVFRVEGIPFERSGVERVLDCGSVTDVREFAGASGAFAASETGLYHSPDDGETWEDLGVPVDGAVWSVLATPEDVIYAGTDDPYLYRSLDGGETWTELTGFRRLPSRGFWESPVDPHSARLRALESPPGRPDRIIAGIESGGIHVSDDGGETWRDHRDAITDDIHQVLPLSPDVYLAATGYLDLDLEYLGHGHALGSGGVHRTTDAGESWTRLDVGNEYAYVRGVLVHDGILYFCGATAPPPDWRRNGIDAALFESTNLGRTFERVRYPGEERELIEAWAVVDGRVIAGSGRYGPSDPSDDVRGRIIRRDDGGYDTVGRLPANVSCIAPLSTSPG